MLQVSIWLKLILLFFGTSSSQKTLLTTYFNSTQFSVPTNCEREKISLLGGPKTAITIEAYSSPLLQYKCNYTWNRGSCHNASEYKIAPIITSGNIRDCNILNIDKWRNVSKDLFQMFKIVLDGWSSDIYVLTVLPCLDQEGQYAIKARTASASALGRPVFCYEYERGRCYDSTEFKIAAKCSLMKLEEWNGILPCSGNFKVEGGGNQQKFELAPCSPYNGSSNVRSPDIQHFCSWPTTAEIESPNCADWNAGCPRCIELEFEKRKKRLLKDAQNVNPDNPQELIVLEDLLVKVVRQNFTTNKTLTDQLYIEIVRLEAWKMEFTTKQGVGSTTIEFTLESDGATRIIAAAFVFHTNTTRIVHEPSPDTGSLTSIKYVSTANATFVAIVGLKVPAQNDAASIKHELNGKAEFTVDSPAQESVCNQIDTGNKTETEKISIKPLCLFFDRAEEKFSDRGCSTTHDEVAGKVTCTCNHLTLFAVLLAVKTTAIPQALKITTYAVESISIAFLVATIVVLHFNKGNSDRIPVQINLATALLLLHVTNVSHDLFAMSDQSCVASTVSNHLFLLCTGMWFLVEGVRLFMATSNPIIFQAQDSKRRFNIFLILGWLVPISMVGISAPVGFYLGIYMKPQPYYEMCNPHHKHTSPIPKYDRCWLAPNTPVFYATVIAPLALVLLINFLIAGKTTYVMLNSRRMKNRGEGPGLADARRAAKSFFILLLVLGGTWSLAFFTGVEDEITSEVFMYIHSVVNGIQGLVVFLLYCVMDDVIRKNIFPCKQQGEVRALEMNLLVRQTANESGQNRRG